MANFDFQYCGFRFRELGRGVVLPLNAYGKTIRVMTIKAEVAIRRFYSLSRVEQLQHKTNPVVILERPAPCRTRRHK